jgi:hypothetical protein
MKSFFPQETSYKKIFRKYNIPLVIASKVIDRSYGYTCHLMAGNIKMPADAAEKLDAFCKKLEEGEIKKPEWRF